MFEYSNFLVENAENDMFLKKTLIPTKVYLETCLLFWLLLCLLPWA